MHYDKFEVGEVRFVILGTDKHDSNQINIPINYYANQLVWYMSTYLDKVKFDMESYSVKANEKAKIL